MYLFKFIKLDQSLCILETLVLYNFKKTLNVKTKKNHVRKSYKTLPALEILKKISIDCKRMMPCPSM